MPEACAQVKQMQADAEPRLGRGAPTEEGKSARQLLIRRAGCTVSVEALSCDLIDMPEGAKGSPCSSGSPGSQGQATAWRRKKGGLLSCHSGPRERKSRLSGDLAASPALRRPLAELSSCSQPSGIGQLQVIPSENQRGTTSCANPSAKGARQDAAVCQDALGILPALTSATAAAALGWDRRPLHPDGHVQASAKHMASVPKLQRPSEYPQGSLKLQSTEVSKHADIATPKPAMSKQHPADAAQQLKSSQREPPFNDKQPQHVLERSDTPSMQQHRQMNDRSSGGPIASPHEPSDEVGSLRVIPSRAAYGEAVGFLDHA